MEGDKTIHRKGFKKIVKFFKKLVNITVIVFALFEVKENNSIDIFQLGSALVMIIGFVLSMIFEFIVISLKKKINKIKENISNKINKAKDLFRRNEKVE